MDREKFKNIMITLVVLVLCLGVFDWMTVREIDHEEEIVNQRVQRNMNTQAGIIEQDIHDAVDATNVVRLSIDANHGKLKDFQHLSMHLFENSYDILSIKLAPKGIVRESYPDKSGPINLYKDKKQAKVLNYAKKYRSAMVEGPFIYKEKKSLAIISPIFYPQKNKRVFYGFVVCMVECPQIFEKAIDYFKNSNYSYELSKNSPLNRKYQVICHSGSLDHSYSTTFAAGSCMWKLRISRREPSVPMSEKIRLYMGSITLSLLITFLLYFVLYLRLQRKKLKQLMATDYLTQIYNRAGFDEATSDYVRKHPDDHCVGVLIDIDDFKYLNDLYGHAIGDEVLKHLSSQLKENLPEGSIIGRNGGDEFSVLLKNTTNEKIGSVLKKLGKHTFCFTYEGKDYHYSLSIGYAEYPVQTSDFSKLIQCADAALYIVKVNDKHGAQVYDASMHNNGRVKLGFKLRDVTNHLPEPFFIYRQDDGELLYVNKKLIHLLGCKNYDDFMSFTHRHFKGIVHPADYQKIRETISQLFNNDHDISLDYRIVTKDHQEIHIQEIRQMAESDYFGQVWYVIIHEK